MYNVYRIYSYKINKMNPEDNNQINQNQAPQQRVPVQPVYTESKSQKIIRQTGTVVAGVGMLASIVAMIKSIFKK